MELVGLLLVMVMVVLHIPCASPYIMHHLSEEQQFALEPIDQVAVVGSRVILPCRVINKKGLSNIMERRFFKHFGMNNLVFLF